jgi:hypothetical protein
MLSVSNKLSNDFVSIKLSFVCVPLESVVAAVNTLNPGIFHQLLASPSLARVYYQEIRDDVFRRLRYVFPCRGIEIIASVLDFLEKLQRVFIIEGREAAQQDVENDSDAPVITFLAVWLLIEDLWGHVTRGATGGRCQGFDRDESSETKV